MTKRSTLVPLAVLAFLVGLALVVLDHLTGMVEGVVLGTPVVLGVLALLWGE